MSKIKPEICVIKIKSSLFCSAGAGCQNRATTLTMGGPLYLITSGFSRSFRSTSSAAPAGAVDNLEEQTEES